MSHPAPEVLNRMQQRPPLRWLFLAATLAACLVLAGGAWFYAHEQAAEERKIADNLDAIAKLKVGQIVQWRNERLADAEYLTRDRNLVAAIDRWLKHARIADRQEAMAELRLMQQHAGYLDVMVADGAGQIRLSSSGRLAAQYVANLESVSLALRERRAVLSDLHSAPDSPAIHVDAVAPLITPDGRTLGVILLQSAAADFLFPMIQAWPTASSSAETSLVRRDGDQVLHLNPLRHRPETALNLRLPLSRSDLPAVQAVLGVTGFFAGRDYRGVPELSMLRAIPDSPWHLVAKIDSVEAYASWNQRAKLIFGMLAVLFLAALTIILWQRHRVAHYRALYAAQQRIDSDHEHQTALRRLLEIVLQDAPLEQTLGDCLDLLLATPWLAVLPNGGIHLMAADGEHLQLVAARNMAPDLQSQCARLSMGECLCGKVAASGKVEFAPHLDPRHDMTFPGREDCTRWCLPLMDDGQVLGVLVLYRPAGSPHHPWQEQFLTTVADILSALIQRKRAEETQHRYAQVLQQCSHYVCILNNQWQIEFVNAAFTQATGYGLDELKRMNSRLLRSGQTPEETFDTIRQSLNAGLPWSGEITSRRKNGEIFVAHQVITPIRQDDGGISHYVAISEDVTEKKRDAEELARYRLSLEEQVSERTRQIDSVCHELADKEKFLRTVTENISGLVSYWDADLYCRYASGPYLAWYGKRPEEVLGIHVQDLIGEAMFRQNEPHIRAALRGQRQVFERSLVKADNTTGHVLVNYIPELADGRVKGIYTTINDVTRIKQAEIDSQIALAESQRLAQVKSDFLANMSHEIRTPLNAVLGLAQIGIRDSQGRSARTNFQRILESGQHLLRVVNDILDFAKIEAGKMSIEQASFVLGEVIDRAVSLTVAPAYAKGLKVRVAEAVDLPACVIGDAMRLTQVLVNLLSNAVKFTERGGVALEAVRDGDALVFRVIDSGIGMTPEQTALLFQAFEQGDGSTTRRFGGTGLGLAISKRLVEAMGGTLIIDSHPGAGSRFELRLPVPDLDAAPGVELAERTASVRLVGLGADECAAVAAELNAHGIGSEVIAAAAAATDAFRAPLPDRLVMALEALRGCDLAELAGIQLVVVNTSGGSIAPDTLPDGAIVVERPLRVRHLCGIPRTHREQGADTATRLAGLRILAAEDVAVNRLVLEDILTHEGAQVQFAEDGLQAVELLREQGGAAFDVVLMDIQMPQMGGIEATGQIRALAPELPVIGLTAHAMAEEKQRCLAAGMVAHVTKPIDTEVLLSTILQHLAPSKALQTPVALPARAASAGAGCEAAAAVVGADVVAEVVDWAALTDRFGGRQEFIDKLLDTVRTSHREVPAKLRDAVRRQDNEAIRFIAHTIKGVAGNIIAGHLQTLARQTEDSARAGRNDAPALAELLAATTEALLAALNVRANAQQEATEAER